MANAAPSGGRRALVTGGGQGLGRAMALGLIEAGHIVLIVDREDALIHESLAKARALGGGDRAFGCCVDLTAPDAVGAIMEAADGRMSGLDVLINNAGVGPGRIRKDYFDDPPVFDELSERQVRLFFEINAIAPILLGIEAARRMRAGGWGRIVNVTTSHDSMMRRGFAPYGSSKAALESQSAIMAQDLEGTGVTVNILLPGGAADTGMIPQETGFDRARLIRPDVMVAPLKWLIEDRPDPPHGKRVLAVAWTPDALASGHPSVAPIGWPGIGSKAILPAA